MLLYFWMLFIMVVLAEPSMIWGVILCKKIASILLAEAEPRAYMDIMQNAVLSFWLIVNTQI